MNDDDDVSCAKRCKEKRKSQYPTLNLHVLGLYMYVYLQLQLNSIYMRLFVFVIIVYDLITNRLWEKKTRNSLSSFRFFSLAAAIMVVCAYIYYYIYYCRVLHIIMFAAIFLSFLFSLTCRFHFDLFSFLFLHASYYNRGGWIMP